ncbi:hypothetical protein ACG1VR_10535 [Cedecea davisae]|uniref:hypothetical protein n=1 Tax=Cedecea davisae TaxID=158484 RepID=UPI00376F3A2F
MKNIVLFVFCMLTSSTTLAASACAPNIIETDICQKAIKIVNEVRPHLPITLSDSVEMLAIDASDNKIIANVRIDMTEEQMIDAAIKNHIQPGVVKTRMSELAKSGVCAGKNPLRSFIRLGGEVSYIYSHPSGKIYNTVNITSCE